MSTSQVLPQQPSLEQLKKQAKALLKAHRAGAPETVARLRAALPKLATASAAHVLAARFSLLDAQLVIAREYGFDSWNQLTLALRDEADKNKAFVQDAFGRHLPPAVVDHIVSHPDMINQLNGEERVMTAFFSDIARFSEIAKCLSPTELIQFLNEYLSEMCAVIEAHGGTVNQFEGDAIVAFFGAPIHFKDHAVRATMACIDQQDRLKELRRQWQAAGVLPPAAQALQQRWAQEGGVFARVRMGLAAGPMVVGNMGTRNQPNYSIMGDTVNLAARFEHSQRLYGTGIMVNEGIHAQVRDQVETRKLDTLALPGHQAPVTAYEVLARKGALSAAQCQVLALYNEGMEAYEDFQFDRAQRLFDRALQINPQDGPSALYAARCREYALTPPKDLIYRA